MCRTMKQGGRNRTVISSLVGNLFPHARIAARRYPCFQWYQALRKELERVAGSRVRLRETKQYQWLVKFLTAFFVSEFCITASGPEAALRQAGQLILAHLAGTHFLLAGNVHAILADSGQHLPRDPILKLAGIWLIGPHCEAIHARLRDDRNARHSGSE